MRELVATIGASQEAQNNQRLVGLVAAGSANLPPTMLTEHNMFEGRLLLDEAISRVPITLATIGYA